MQSNSVVPVTTPEMPPTLVFSPHALRPGLDRELVYAPVLQGETIQQYLDRLGITGKFGQQGFILTINGRQVPQSMWRVCRPRPGTLINLYAVVRGGGGSGNKNPLAVVAMIGLMVAAPYLGAGFVTGGASFSLAGLSASELLTARLIGAGISVIGGMVINSVFPPPKPHLRDTTGLDIKESPTYSLSGGSNNIRRYEPMPKIVGTHKIFPDFGMQPFNEFQDDDQFSMYVMDFGYNDIVISNHKIGDTTLDAYTGVTLEESGTDGVLDLFPGNVDSTAGGALTAAAGFIQRTTSAGTKLIGIDIAGSLFRLGDKGLENRSVIIEVQWAVTGSGVWNSPTLIPDTSPQSISTGVGWDTNLIRVSQQVYDNNVSAGLPAGQIRFTNGTRKPLRRTLSLQVDVGQYDVRIRRVTPDETDDRATSDITWSVLRSYQPDAADYTGRKRLALKIRASGQIQGALEQFSVIASAKCQVFDFNTQTWSQQATSNPAWWFLDAARGTFINGKRVWGAGLTDDKIDIENIKSFAQWCDNEGLTMNAVFDQQQRVFDVLSSIALMGRGSISWASGKLGVIWDAPNLPVTAVFGMANILPGSFSVEYATDDIADVIEAEYVNADNDYQQEFIRVNVPTAESNARVQRIQLFGRTNQTLAAQDANLYVAQNVYRNRKYRWKSRLEAMVCARGDVVQISHDMAALDFSGRLVEGSNARLLVLPRKVPLFSVPSYVMLVEPNGSSDVYRVREGVGDTDKLVLLDPLPFSIGYLRFLDLSGVAGNYASAQVDPPVNVDIRGAYEPASTSQGHGLVYRSRSYAVRLRSDGKLQLFYSRDGLEIRHAISTVSAGFSADEVLYWRVTRDGGVSTGDIKFYTSPDGIAWNQLGDTITSVSGTIFDSGILTEVGRGGGTYQPVLAFDFTGETLEALIGNATITFTRTGATATRVNASGSIEVVPADTPRFNYDLTTGKCKGLLIEGTRTQLLPYSVFQGSTGNGVFPTGWANAGLSGLAMTTVSGPVLGYTTNYVQIRRNNTGFQGIQSAADIGYVVGTVYRSSVYVRVPTGVTAEELLAYFPGATPSSVQVANAETLNAQPKDQWIRYDVSVTFTSVGATTKAGYVSSGTINGQGCDIALPQFEAGALVTSWIPSTGAVVTRNEDVPTITVAGGAQGTFVVEYSLEGYALGLSQTIAQLDDGGEANRIWVGRNTSEGLQVFGGAGDGSLNVGFGTFNPAIDAEQRISVGYQTNNYAASSNGSAVISDLVATVPTSTTVRLGRRSTGDHLYGHIRGFALHSSRLSDTDLPQVSDPTKSNWDLFLDQIYANGKIHSVEIRNSVDSAVVSGEFNPSTGTVLDAISLESDSGEVWTIHQADGPVAELVEYLENVKYPESVPYDFKWFYGQTPTPGKKVKIDSFKPVDAETVEISAVDEVPEYYTSKNNLFEFIPPFTQLNTVQLTNLELIEDGVRAATGYLVKVTATWQSTGDYQFADVKVGYNDTPPTLVQSSLRGHSFEVIVSDGTKVTIEVTAYGRLGRVGKSSKTSATLLVDFAALKDPSAVSNFVAVATDYGINLSWDEIPDADRDLYEVRQGTDFDSGVPVFLGKAHECTDLPKAAGTYHYWIKAIDAAERKSPVATQATIIISAIAAPNPVLAVLNGEDIVLSWTPPSTQFAVDHYKVSYGPSYPGTELTDTKSTSLKVHVDWSDSRTFWVTAVDVPGQVGAPGSTSFVVTPPSATTISAQVIDNNVLLRWIDVTETLPIKYYEVRKGNVFATAQVIGTVSALFDVLLESSAGTYVYWISGVDSAGNLGDPGSLAVPVNQPPDYVLRFDQDSQLDSWNTEIANWLRITPEIFKINQDATHTLTTPTPPAGLKTNGITVEAWVEPTVLANWWNILSNSWQLQVGSWLLYISADGKARFGVYDGAQKNAVSDAALKVNEFRHLVGTYDGATVKLYVDGVLQAITAASTASLYVNGAILSSCSGGATGNLGPIRMYGRALTATEVDEHYRNLFKSETKLVLAVDFDEGEGTTAFDDSDFQNDLQLLGGVTWTQTVLDGRVDSSETLAAYYPVNRNQTLAEWGTANGFTTFQDAITAGYTTPFTPTPTTAKYSEVVDFGTQLPATKISTLLEAANILGTVGVSTTISVSPEHIELANRVWALGEKMVPFRNDNSTNADVARQYLWEVTTAGTSTGTPVWPASVTPNTTTVTQNGVVWTARNYWTDFPSVTSVFTTQFRYVKVTQDISGAGGNNLQKATRQNFRLDVKLINDAGTVVCSSSDVGGTQVNFNVAFVDVTSITVTAQGTAPVNAVYDFVDTPNPTGFKVLLFDPATGNRVSGTASWSAKGV